MPKDEPKGSGRRTERRMQISNDYQAERRKVAFHNRPFAMPLQMKRAVK